VTSAPHPRATVPIASSQCPPSDRDHFLQLIEVWGYPADTEVPYFRSRVVCAKCGSRRNKIDVHPNWRQPTQPSLTGKVFRWGYRLCEHKLKVR
jgi:hypothetical protein